MSDVTISGSCCSRRTRRRTRVRNDVALVDLRRHDEQQQERMFSAACCVVMPAACAALSTSCAVMSSGSPSCRSGYRSRSLRTWRSPFISARWSLSFFWCCALFSGSSLSRSLPSVKFGFEPGPRGSVDLRATLAALAAEAVAEDSDHGSHANRRRTGTPVFGDRGRFPGQALRRRVPSAPP